LAKAIHESNEADFASAIKKLKTTAIIEHSLRIACFCILIFQLVIGQITRTRYIIAISERHSGFAMITSGRNHFDVERHTGSAGAFSR